MDQLPGPVFSGLHPEFDEPKLTTAVTRIKIKNEENGKI